jgi:hypothetical protein
LCACDAEEAEVEAVEAVLWRRGAGAVVEGRAGALFDLTAVFARRGRLPVAARRAWRTI